MIGKNLEAANESERDHSSSESRSWSTQRVMHSPSSKEQVVMHWK
jgi:hypothetical protein